MGLTVGRSGRSQADARAISEEAVRAANNAAHFAKKNKKSPAEQARLAQKAKDLNKAHEDQYGPIR